MAQSLVHDKGLSIKVSCKLLMISEHCYRYRPKLSDDNTLIAHWLKLLTDKHKNWGFQICFSYLRNVKGYKWNHKRVYRIYTQLCFNLRIKPKRRLKRDKPEALTVPSAVNQVWSMDFMHARLYKGKAVRLLNIIDDFNREGLAIDIKHSHPSNSVIRTLENIIEYRGKPSAIRCDNGPEYISSKIVTWAKENGIELLYIQPGKPQQNAYIERYNRTVRYDWLNQYEFDSLSDMQDFSTKWLWHYNHERPNMALGGYTPMQKLYGVAA